MYLALPQKNRTCVNNYTAKVGQVKYIEKRLADGPSSFLLLLPFWRPWDFGGLIRRAFLDVFGAAEKRKYVFVASCAAIMGK